jgi:hypothetical protein
VTKQDTSTARAFSGGDGGLAPFWFDVRRLRRKQEPNPNLLLQIPDRNQDTGRNLPRRAGKGIRFARADNLA